MPSAYIATYFSEIPDRHLRYSWNGTCDPAATDPWKQPDSCWTQSFDIPVASGSTTIDPNLRTQLRGRVHRRLRQADLQPHGRGHQLRLAKTGQDDRLLRSRGHLLLLHHEHPERGQGFPGVGPELASKPYWEYQALQLSLQKRFGSDGFQFIASYTYVIKSNGWPVGTTRETSGRTSSGPPRRWTRSATARPQSPHYVKFNGSYTMPWKMVLGVGAYWNSGNLYTPVSWHYPDGSWTCCTTWYVDKRGSKNVGNNWEADVRDRTTVSDRSRPRVVYANVFNVFNNQQPTARNNNVDFANYGQPYIWQDPRWWQLGLKIEF